MKVHIKDLEIEVKEVLEYIPACDLARFVLYRYRWLNGGFSVSIWALASHHKLRNEYYVLFFDCHDEFGNLKTSHYYIKHIEGNKIVKHFGLFDEVNHESKL